MASYGYNGVCGRHVLDSLHGGGTALSTPDDRVFVLGRRCPPSWPGEKFVAAELTEADSVRRAIEQIKPDFVIHTAGRTQPASDEELYRANFWTTIHLLAAVRSMRKPVRIVLSGSAASSELSILCTCRWTSSHVGYPQDAYGRSKWLATSAGLAERSPLEVIVVRVFNPIGPGAPTSQAFGRFAERLTDACRIPLIFAWATSRHAATLSTFATWRRDDRVGAGAGRARLQCRHRPIAPGRRRTRPADSTERPTRAVCVDPALKTDRGRPIRVPASTGSSSRQAGNRQSRGNAA